MAIGEEDLCSDDPPDAVTMNSDRKYLPDPGRDRRTDLDLLTMGSIRPTP